MQTVSFGEIQDVRLTLEFPVSGAGPLKTFFGDVFVPDTVVLAYSVDSIGEESWRLEDVSISGVGGSALPGRFDSERFSVGSPWQDAIARLPSWAWNFAANVDPSKELGCADE